MSGRGKKIVILNPAQRRAISQSPARLEIIDAMSEIGPCSVAELARELGRSPQSLYYHLEIMVKVGLLRESGRRKAGKRDEALYDMVSEHFRLAGSGDTAEDKRRTLLRFNNTVLKLTERNYHDALSHDLVRRVGKRENIYVRRQRGRMTDQQLARFYELLEEMGRLFSRTTRGQEGAAPRPGATRCAEAHPYALTVSLVPLDEHAGTAAASGELSAGARRSRRSRRSA